MSEQVQSILHDIDPATLKEWLDNDEALLVDVREQSEYVSERIPQAQLMALSVFQTSQLPETNGKKLILHCRSGNRSRKAAQLLFAVGHQEAYHLDGGLMNWKQQGHDIESNPSAPIDVIRQVQMIAGSLVLLGVGLGAYVSPWCLTLSGLMGAGLFYAGLSNTCGMAALLSRMPWNQIASTRYDESSPRSR
ncbi:MAG: rhodanese-like domain-containing protein [Gemmatimonadetes bacterium]|jgi:rhodanese-related sulfurtransferase|nr:rhodanese-like domain-containing protein [Rhodospirillaceae bacterium]MBT5801774.1 rhodanese-like domain-containing protein [Gemmatimonadota bacterium]MBT6902963.1 rhodanese-like domain-containing protein [Gemmatimonadota bacterium]